MRTLLLATLYLVLCGWLVAGCAPSDDPSDVARVRQQVLETERAFARSMAERDEAAFASFLSREAVFFDGDTALRGSAEIAAAWKQFFETDAAPFSWEPEQVEVLDSGGLALTSGPVHDAQGTLIGRFTSIWRREGANQWRIVFDKGNAACPTQ
jgi:ketosteroid isomerase-like protein